MNRQILEPFSSSFDPLTYSQSKSHFQLSFIFVWTKARRQALNDFYAFCRLVDDLADEESLATKDRLQALESISSWIETPSLTHPFWQRLHFSIIEFGIPRSILHGIIRGVKKDMKAPGDFIQFASWKELNEYCQGVASDVGLGVMCILGVDDPRREKYAEALGRCVQYLNIMRDLEEDLRQNRIYVPFEYLSQLGVAEKNISHECMPKLREELYQRALEYRKQAPAFSWKCFPAELMVNIYVQASRKKWRWGDSTRLNRVEKIRAVFRATLSFLNRRYRLLNR